LSKNVLLRRELQSLKDRSKEWKKLELAKLKTQRELKDSYAELTHNTQLEKLKEQINQKNE
jgi:hypothetical protein